VKEYPSKKYTREIYASAERFFPCEPCPENLGLYCAVITRDLFAIAKFYCNLFNHTAGNITIQVITYT